MWRGYEAPLLPWKPPESEQRCRYDRCRHILIAKDYMGDNDDRLTFWVSGAGFSLLAEVMQFFHGKHLMQGYRLKLRHLTEFTHNRNYWYDTIFIDGLNTHTMSEDTLLQMIVHLLKKKAWCKVRIVSIQQLLNH